MSSAAVVIGDLKGKGCDVVMVIVCSLFTAERVKKENLKVVCIPTSFQVSY